MKYRGSASPQSYTVHETKDYPPPRSESKITILMYCFAKYNFETILCCLIVGVKNKVYYFVRLKITERMSEKL